MSKKNPFFDVDFCWEVLWLRWRSPQGQVFFLGGRDFYVPKQKHVTGGLVIKGGNGGLGILNIWFWGRFHRNKSADKFLSRIGMKICVGPIKQEAWECCFSKTIYTSIYQYLCFCWYTFPEDFDSAFVYSKDELMCRRIRIFDWTSNLRWT